MKKILVILIMSLLLSSNAFANKWHIKMKKKEKKDFAHYVLKAQSDNKMVFNLRNIQNSKMYKFFDKFEPLKDKELESKIETLLDEVGFKSSGVFSVDASKRDNRLAILF